MKITTDIIRHTVASKTVFFFPGLNRPRVPLAHCRLPKNGIKHGIYRVYTNTINIKYFRLILLHLNNRNLLCVCPTD